MTSEFIKKDQDKTRLELIDPHFIDGIGRVLTFGANKYSADNWKHANTPEKRERIKGSLLRHLMAYLKGEQLDPETNESHLYALACNAMFLDYFDRTSPKGL